METANYTKEIIGILVVLAGLVGLLVRHLIAVNKTAQNWIRELVADNLKNTTNFIEVINHQRTKDREMQQRNVDAINQLKGTLSTNNEINSKLITMLEKSHGK